MVSDDFTRVLARVQSDYGFYIDCQTDPDAALEGYDVTPDERSQLADPEKLADLLVHGVMITISGTHDWVNRAAPTKKSTDTADDASVAADVEAIQQAGSDEERTGAVLRLMGLVG